MQELKVGNSTDQVYANKCILEDITNKVNEIIEIINKEK